VVAIALLVVLYFFPISLWITALFSGVRVSLLQLAFMRVRKVPPSLIVNSLITSTKAGLRLTADDLETHFLAGGNVPSVIKALISADKANIPLDFKQATQPRHHGLLQNAQHPGRHRDARLDCQPWQRGQRQR